MSLFQRFLPVLFLVLLTSPAVAAEDDILITLSGLARAGAAQLALQRLEEGQPTFAEDPVRWMRFERERIYLLRALEDLDAVIARLAALPDGVSEDFRDWAHTEWATALLDNHQPEEALAVARDLLWRATGAEPEVRARWRRMVIRSYLTMDALEDAQTALVRYRQDFGDGSEEWNRLRAQVALRTGRYAEVYEVAADSGDAYIGLLDAAARLRGAVGTPEQVHAEAVRLAGDEKQPAGVRVLAWQLAVEAAQRLPAPVYIDALEHALGREVATDTDTELFAVSPDRLWNAWLAHGQALGNREQRLIGSDEDWYFPATEAMEKDPPRARVLFAVLAVHGTSPQRRELAHEYLVSLLDDLPRGEALIRNLYLHADRFADPADLPGVIRYRLIDEALEGGDLALASRLMEGMEEAPPGTDAVEWSLRRARVAIHTARPQQGAERLAAMLEAETELSDEQLDRWVQVVFDLQTIHAHEQALSLFERLMRRELPPRRVRELLFWQADSWRALGKPAQAAYLYLQSATLLDAAAMDPWAQTARYHAAESLADAGLLQDARRIYTSLLNSTGDPGRRAVLRNEIQRLQLRAAGEKSP